MLPLSQRVIGQGVVLHNTHIFNLVIIPIAYAK